MLNIFIAALLIFYPVAAKACSVADPHAMGCGSDEEFSTFSCRCEKIGQEYGTATSCTGAVQELESFLQSQSRSCSADSDCEARYYRLGDRTHEPVILPVSAATEGFIHNLMVLQSNARKQCAKEWENLPAQSPSPATPVCRANMCANANGP